MFNDDSLQEVYSVVKLFLSSSSSPLELPPEDAGNGRRDDKKGEENFSFLVMLNESK